MALSPRHWVLATVLACAGIAVAYLPPKQVPRSLYEYSGPYNYSGTWTASPERIRERWTQTQLEIATQHLSAARSRDSLLRSLARLPRPARSAATPLLFQESIARSAQLAIRATLDTVWASLQPTRPEMRVVVIVETRERWPAHYMLPSGTDGTTCVAVLRLPFNLRWAIRGERPRADTVPLQPWLKEHLGPCAYYAAFGKPGPHVGAWLRTRGYDLAYAIDWEPGTGDDSAPRRIALAQTRWTITWNASFDFLACAEGDEARCVTALHKPPPGWERSASEPNVVWYRWWSDLYDGSRYFSDLVRGAGRERFARFWRSPDPVDSAFDGAFGTSLGQWTARWARRRTGGIIVPPKVDPRSALGGLALAGAVMALLLVYTARRQVA